MVGLMYKKGDLVFIFYESFSNYVRVSSVNNNNFYRVFQITKPIYGNCEPITEYYLNSKNSRLCSDLEALLIGKYDEI